MQSPVGGILRGSASALMLCLMPAPAHSQQSLELSEEMISAAGDFITSLNDMQRNSALFDFDDDERSNWFFTPVDRRGVPYKVMDEEQRAAARRLLQVFLSAGGFAKAEEVRSGDRAGTRVLHREEDLARELVTSLDAGQKSQAILDA